MHAATGILVDRGDPLTLIYRPRHEPSIRTRDCGCRMSLPPNRQDVCYNAVPRLNRVFRRSERHRLLADGTVPDACWERGVWADWQSGYRSPARMLVDRRGNAGAGLCRGH